MNMFEMLKSILCCYIEDGAGWGNQRQWEQQVVIAVIETRDEENLNQDGGREWGKRDRAKNIQEVNEISQYLIGRG